MRADRASVKNPRTAMKATSAKILVSIFLINRRSVGESSQHGKLRNSNAYVDYYL